MDSDSDSGGSHVSSTPPRDLQPPPPLPPQPTRPSLFPILISSAKARTKVRAFSNPKPSSTPVKLQPKANPQPLQQDRSPSSIPSPNLLDLPFRIHRTSDQSFADGRPSRSKFASFSKKTRPSLNFDPTDADSTLPSVSASHTKTEAAEMRCFELVPQEVSGEADNCGNWVKSLKRHPNAIGGDVNTMLVKRPKCVSEGNFVKLNINGHGRRFIYKGRNKNHGTSGGRRPFRGSKRKSKAKGKGEAGTDVCCDEDGLGLESTGRQGLKERGGLKFDSELIEEAVADVRNEPSDQNLLKLLKLTHCHDSFRLGQLKAIRMVLAGKSTMLVLPTGAGKSLCYQLPAMVLPGITLVVSPLVALMIDQLKQLPPVIHGGLLCSSQRPEETSETLRLLQEGAIKVLFVSPERFLNAEFISIFSATPLISLVVVDEAHCISEWSHNFRPSYMRLRASLLRSRFNVQCILAMTATATTKTLNDVMCALEIPPINLVQASQLRDNLQLTISLSKNRMRDLMILLKSSPFLEVQSIIIYCKFQSETDLISKYLCDNNISAKSYHSGIPAKDRSRTQELFCSNKIRVVVATVAFGMGLDKTDVGAVIHYSLPESLEEYVQEIGRAGRDGRLSYCHLFVDDITYFKLRSLMYSDGVDEYAVNKFLCQVFSNDMDSPGQICSLVKESACRKFDMKEEVMLTILTHLELGETQYLCLLPQINVNCTLNFHQTPPAMLAANDIMIATILNKSETKNGQHVFSIPIVANIIGISTFELSNQLLNLKLRGQITYEMKDPAYCYKIVDVPKDFCSLAADITKWLSEVESCKVQKIDAMFNAAAFAVKECQKMHGCHGAQHTLCLQKKIFQYFSGSEENDAPTMMAQSSPFLRTDIKVFLQSNSQAKFTPRAIARIMHGIGSPAYPSATWSKTHFWGRYVQVNFQLIMELAKVELMNFVGKNVM